MIVLVFLAAVFAQIADPDTLAAYLGNKFITTLNATLKPCAPTCPYGRLAHVKTHGCLTGKLDLKANIDPSYAFGLFDSKAQGKSSFPVVVRFSNGRGGGFVPGAPTAADSGADVRGMAIKVFGVSGTKMVFPSAETVDFLAVTSEKNFMASLDDAQPFFDATFENSTLSLAGWAALHPITAARLGFFASTGSGYELTQHTFWPIAPLSLGTSAAKFRFTPCASNNATDPLDEDSDDYLANNLATYISTQSACWTVAAQLYVDDTSTPIEDTSVIWSADWVDLATLTLTAGQDAWSSPTKQKMCEEVSFNPWQTHVDNAPQGGVQTLRKTVYTQEQLTRHMFMQQQSGDWTQATLQTFSSVTDYAPSINNNNRQGAKATLATNSVVALAMSIVCVFASIVIFVI